MITVNVNVKGAEDFMAALKRHPEKVARTAESVIKQQARALAVSFARETLPEGLGEKGAEKLKTRIAQDIKRLFPSKDSASKVYDYIRRQDEKLARAFWYAYKSGDDKAQARILRRAKIPRGLDPVAHQTARVNGRVPTSAEIVSFAAPSRLASYIRREQKKAGLAKAGWVAAANALGGRVRTRTLTGKSVQKFPKYLRALSRRGNLGGAQFRPGPRASAKIWNIVAHIGEAFPRSRYDKALAEGEREFLKALDRSVQYLNNNRFNKSSAA